MIKDNIHAPIDLIHMDCIHCALNQVINTTEITGTPEPERRMLLSRALRMLADGDINRNNCIQIAEIYRMVTDYLGAPDPYRETRLYFDRELYSLLPELRRHVWESDDPLRAAVRTAIAGNLIDMAALGVDVTLEKALEKVHDVDREGLRIDHCDALDKALRQAKTLLVLGDNCGEIALDRLLIEVLRKLYPQLEVKYGVRGIPTVNDVTREDAVAVEMEQVAEVIDNGDGLLTTILCRCSEEFKKDFYAADVIIAKGMGNYEGLHCCDRGNIFFMLIAKCRVLAEMTGTPKGSIICLEGTPGSGLN